MRVNSWEQLNSSGKISDCCKENSAQEIIRIYEKTYQPRGSQLLVDVDRLLRLQLKKSWASRDHFR